ncbi:MAG: hypothetical protein ACJ757_01830 [Gaiellaceae bacterium]
MSEPNEATKAEPVAAATSAPDATPDATPDKPKSSAQTPFWKRWLGKS